MQEKVLVTGGTGFVGSRLIMELLQAGYEVRTTIRSISSKNKVLEILEENGIKNVTKLTFFEADLAKDDNWDSAMEGCDYVLSVSSPVFFEIPKNEDEAIQPAVEGIIRILKAAEKAKVKRVVMTSNFGAVGFSNKDEARLTTEKDWTQSTELGLSIYEKSKLLAEEAAWDFVNKADSQLELTTINPVAIFGPALSTHVSGSFEVLEGIVNGSMKRIPDISLNIVDVRDVVDLHIRAMTSPIADGERFIASADGQISLPEIATIIRKKRPALAKKVPEGILASWVIRFFSLFSKKAKEGALLSKVNRNISNAKAKELLGWEPMATNEEIVLTTLDSMVQFNLIK